MSVHQLPDGRWIVHYRNQDPDSPGRFKREYFGRGIEAEARARERDAQLPKRQATHNTPAPRDAGPTIAELVEA